MIYKNALGNASSNAVVARDLSRKPREHELSGKRAFNWGGTRFWCIEVHR